MNSRVTIITGPIGSGKSTACNYIQEKGIATADLDIVSNNILNSEISLDFLNTNFAECINQNKVDRKLLAEIVFTNLDKLKILESFLHPLVTDKVATLIKETDGDLFIEASAPKNIYKLYPTIVIFANEKIRRIRLQSRGMSLEDIDNRINTQPEESWWKSIGTVIENTSFSDLQVQIQNLINSEYEQI